MPDHIFKSTFGTRQSPDRQLLGPGDQRLDVKGFAFRKLTHRQTCIQEKDYIVKSSKLLLGMPAIHTLGLIRNIPRAFIIRAICTVPSGKQNEEESRDQPRPNFISKEDVQVKYPQLFGGLA